MRISKHWLVAALFAVLAVSTFGCAGTSHSDVDGEHPKPVVEHPTEAPQHYPGRATPHIDKTIETSGEHPTEARAEHSGRSEKSMTAAKDNPGEHRTEHSREHPKEHPEGPKEHPAEHPNKRVKVTKAILATEITEYVRMDSELKGGYFLVYDKKQKKPLALTLDKVHKERLATIGKGVYFACADFKATDGTMYDVDIFMKGKPGNMTVTDVMIHKQAGKPRFTWYEENGVWKRKPVD
jgi:hypothetical protein